MFFVILLLDEMVHLQLKSSLFTFISQICQIMIEDRLLVSLAITYLSKRPQ